MTHCIRCHIPIGPIDSPIVHVEDIGAFCFDCSMAPNLKVYVRPSQRYLGLIQQHDYLTLAQVERMLRPMLVG